MPVPNVLSILPVINHHRNRSTCSCQNYGFYRPQRSCGKVMFLHLSMILFTGRRSLSRGGLFCPVGVSVEEVSVQEGSLFRGSSVKGCLCPGRGSLSRGWRGLWGISVQGGLCSGGLKGLCLEGFLSGRPSYGNVRTVRILLECILVYILD